MLKLFVPKILMFVIAMAVPGFASAASPYDGTYACEFGGVFEAVRESFSTFTLQGSNAWVDGIQLKGKAAQDQQGNRFSWHRTESYDVILVKVYQAGHGWDYGWSNTYLCRK